MLRNFNNKTEKAGDEIRKDLKIGSKVRVAAAIFSIYGFESLKKELENIESLRFVFTDPTFIEMDKASKEHRLFEIHANNRKRAIGGSDFEINLKNELKGRAIARECKDWIQKKVIIKTNTSKRYIQPQLIIDNDREKIVYSGIDEFSSAGFGYENDNAILRQIIKSDEYEMSKQFIANFDSVWNDENALKDVTQEVAEYISNLYKENSPEFIYYLTLYNIFDEFLEDITEDEIANERTGFKESLIWNKMYAFQKDAVLGIINKLERYNGCILADSVGLGKTFTALGVIKYYQERNKSILVLCPKKLGDNWLTFLTNYEDNHLYKDRFNYDVLFHSDLSRKKGFSSNIDLSRVNWGNYDLVVIDESHNFRNNDQRNDRVTRYQKLLDDVMRAGVKTKVLMLSATPVNNRFMDLRNQIALAYEGHTNEIDERIDDKKSIDLILTNAQKTFNEWSKLPIEERNPEELLKRLSGNFDFFKLLDSITIARSRKHIEKYYDMKEIGEFPNRLRPITHRPDITDIEDFMEMRELYERLVRLNMSVYSPFEYLLADKKEMYSELYDTEIDKNIGQAGREKGIQKLMRVNLLKRLESSVDSFRITLGKFITNIEDTIKSIDEFEKGGENRGVEAIQVNDNDYDEDSTDWTEEDFSIGDKVKINLADMNTSGWKEDLKSDLVVAKSILIEMQRVTPEHDQKLNDLKMFIKNKIDNPINSGNKKILIFTAFADTANYLYNQIIDYNKKELGLETAKITGTGKNECTLSIDTQFNNLLINFSPISKERHSRHDKEKEIDILIATDCISEGQNLQDCDTLINYDIHWNPVRIIQRFGRIDRIGSINKDIQLINFWPQLSLDDYINLKNRVESKMFMVDATATGEDNVLTNKSSDLLFRKKQLEKLQEEVVDLEEMGSGVSITDLGLNDFRMDLVNYMKEKGSLDGIPNGMHSVCKKIPEIGIEEGVIYVLRNVNSGINIDQTNQLHPFYLVYIKENGEILSNHLNVKNTLDIIRAVSRGRDEPIQEVFSVFNNETDDGKKMEKYSDLLGGAIESILNVKDASDVESLFSRGGTTALRETVKGLEDFELISFIVIK
ncbi:MAG: helicase-related protein [Minisyncoccus archaeiphilus]|uniref:helicase-related protein n=1 Tax=Minisyncoccus archaeiphilus TaxID=3238481 RepID=UPI002B14DEC7|nr:MAG: helicase-related protein [Candidatus Parcubacteria bacterium]